MFVWKLGLGPNIVVASATINFAIEEKAVNNSLKNVRATEAISIN
jgi:hypothetical protein